jgi:hypothetical protein
MNTPHCCQIQPRPADHARRSTPWFHRAGEAAGWILPSAVLALLPKCPACVAAYVALGTGFMMTPASAHLLLRTVTALCIGAVAFCLVRPLLKQSRQ